MKIDISGRRFGELVAVRETAERRQGSVVWACVCDCGKGATRTASQLLRGERIGQRAACLLCLKELSRGKDVAYYEARHDAYCEQWEGSGSLWSHGQTVRLMEQIRADLENEFGEVVEHCQLPVTVEPGWTHHASAQESRRKSAERQTAPATRRAERDLYVITGHAYQLGELVDRKRVA